MKHIQAMLPAFGRDMGVLSAKNAGGMGLSICRWIVNAHRRKISVTNNPGDGATFGVVLPAIDSARNGY